MTMTEVRPPPEGDTDADRVNLDYIKSNHFRTIAPNGMLSSVTPQGSIQLALFSERQAIPQRVVHKYDSEGFLGEVLEVIGRDAIVREVEAVVTLDVGVAKMLVRSLADYLKEIEGTSVEENNDS